MNRRTKKRIAVIAVMILLLAIAAVAATLATPNAKTRNVITTGKVDIELGDGVQRNTQFDVMPGITVQQPITVKNVEGAADAYVRVKLEVADVTKVDGTRPDSAELEPLLNMGGPDRDENWLKGEDGWWYYTKNDGVLAGNIQTEELTLSIQFDGPNTGNDYQGATGNIRVVAQAVQVKNNTEGGVIAAFERVDAVHEEIYAREEWKEDASAQENNQEGEGNA